MWWCLSVPETWEWCSGAQHTRPAFTNPSSVLLSKFLNSSQFVFHPCKRGILTCHLKGWMYRTHLKCWLTQSRSDKQQWSKIWGNVHFQAQRREHSWLPKDNSSIRLWPGTTLWRWDLQSSHCHSTAQLTVRHWDSYLLCHYSSLMPPGALPTLLNIDSCIPIPF